MLQIIADWVVANWVELVGACTGITYLILEIKQNMWLWPVGLLNAIFYAVIFFTGGLYAITTLQIYYVVMMIYGWCHWVKGGQGEPNDELPVSKVPVKYWCYIIVAAAIICCAYYVVLLRYTDSQAPVGDAFVTAWSIVGTWMLAKKYIEQWYVWIGVNMFSVWLYASQGLVVTSVLYAFYAIIAIIGYFNWKKTLCRE
ncbi:MAG: nicotinamide mononucleotide transporter [Paludibacteraceae bacterium]|nr:nicotinamide mononucleotide transporter [Paludibacteraceae bacterium]